MIVLETLWATVSTEALSAELSAAVEEFNSAEGDPEERVRLMHHIRELRARLAIAQAASAEL